MTAELTYAPLPDNVAAKVKGAIKQVAVGTDSRAGKLLESKRSNGHRGGHKPPLSFPRWSNWFTRSAVLAGDVCSMTGAAYGCVNCAFWDRKSGGSQAGIHS